MKRIYLSCVIGMLGAGIANAAPNDIKLVLTNYATPKAEGHGIGSHGEILATQFPDLQLKLTTNGKIDVASRATALQVYIDPTLQKLYQYSVAYDHYDLSSQLYKNFNEIIKGLSNNNGFFIAANGYHQLDLTANDYRETMYGYVFTKAAELSSNYSDAGRYNYYLTQMLDDSGKYTGAYRSMFGITDGSKSSDIEFILADFDITQKNPTVGDTACVIQVVDPNSGAAYMHVSCAKVNDFDQRWRFVSMSDLTFDISGTIYATYEGSKYLANAVVKVYPKN